MAENQSTDLPQFSSTQELIDFFDTHDMGEFGDEMPEAHFRIVSRSRQGWDESFAAMAERHDDTLLDDISTTEWDRTGWEW